MKGLSLSKISDNGVSLAEEAAETTKAPASI
jgi:hypothetical protein